MRFIEAAFLTNWFGVNRKKCLMDCNNESSVKPYITPEKIVRVILAERRLQYARIYIPSNNTIHNRI